MAPFKLTPAQHTKVMNHPVHYNIEAVRYNEKEKMFECNASPSDLQIIKSIVDEPVSTSSPKDIPVISKPPQEDNEDTEMAGFQEK
jgi:hypothetical protein